MKFHAKETFQFTTKAHEGHEERTAGLEKRSKFNRLYSSFVLFVTFVVIYTG